MKYIEIIMLNMSVSALFCQVYIPNTYIIDEKQGLDKTLSPGLRSNGISEIVLQGESTAWLGTGRGVSYMIDSLSIFTLDTLFINNGDYLLLNDAISAIRNGATAGRVMIRF